MSKRMPWLIVALLATLAAVFWTQPQETDGELVEAVVRHPAKSGEAAPANPAVSARASSSAQAGERMGQMQANLFPSQTWVPPPPPPPKPPPPPPPRPPALPFKFEGRWIEDGKETVFLSQGNRTFPVTVGQVLPGAWRVEEFTRGGVVFTYLPLDMQSTLGTKP